MTLDQLKERISEAERKLDSKMVADAASILLDVSSGEGFFDLHANIENIRDNYGYMLHYLIEGAEDPSRETVRDKTVSTLRDIADDILIRKQTKDSPEILFSTVRICDHRNLDFSRLYSELKEVESKADLAESAGSVDTSLSSEKDRILQDIFNLLWSCNRRKADVMSAAEAAVNDDSSEALKKMVISAFTLSLLRYYDKDKFLALIDIYEKSSEAMAAKAIVGVLLTMRRHADRISADKDIMDRLSLWQDSLVTYSRLRDVARELIRTRDTDRVTSKMKEEVIPELMKLRPDILKKMREQSMESDTPAFDNNPEWEEMLEKNGIADKLRELSEMQTEGADLMMVTFSNLKGFPFFNNVFSWFIPFDASHPSLGLPDKMRDSLLTLFGMGENMCESDKYSLALALRAMPEQQKDMVLGQFEAQMTQFIEENRERLLKTARPEFNSAATSFIRELYRFFKLFRKKDEFDDPFIYTFDLQALPVVGNMLADEEIVRVTSEFYFKRGYFAEALSLFRKLEKSDGGESAYWEKTGFCLQNLKMYKDAAEAYSRAELLKEPGQWLIKKLAYINRKIGNYELAARYYSKAIENDPDNVTLLRHHASALFESGDYKGSLASFYHALYLDPADMGINRSLAWVELMAGNTDKSTQLYECILEDSPSAEDFLNAGHAYLVTGNIKRAIELYRQSADNDISRFESLFKRDSDTLLSLGVNRLTLELLLDSLKMK